jgi:hypothetical protein
MTDRYCAVCGKPYAEKHHIVFKGQGGLDAAWNIIYLCPLHHRGNMGPHRNRNIDKQCKLQVQAYLFVTLADTYYADKPGLFTANEWRKITKSLTRYSDGYRREDIIRRCMGGKLYEEG